MAERQSEHRQHLEKQVVEANCSNERRGQIFAFVLSLIAFGAGVFLLATDKAGWGTGLIGGDALAVIGLFIYGRESQKKERQAKERQQQEHIASAARRYPRLNRRR